MTERVDLYDITYGNFTDEVIAAVRKETFGADFGQNSWTTADEYERLVPWLDLGASGHALEVASGSGGPARHLARMTGCRVTGIDSNDSAVATAQRMAAESNEQALLEFRAVDANARLPFDDGSFDALICIDSMCHLSNRLAVLREWYRVLRAGGRALFTDPVVVTGAVTNEELAIRSSIHHFLFAPRDVNERLIAEAGLRLARQEDVTDNAALVASRWHGARQAHETELRRIEGPERFEGLQRFFAMVHTLTSERRLSRIAYMVEKPAG